MMYKDPPMATFTKNDGMISLMHCQERKFPSRSMSYTCIGLSRGPNFVPSEWEIPLKLKCEMVAKCVAYTFKQAELKCILHSSTEKGLKSAPGKQTGLKKSDFILSLPEMDFCSEKRRKRRCRWEPNCDHVNCFRNAPKTSWARASESWFFELSQSKMGYDAGFTKDEFECNSNKCECAHFDQTVIGKLKTFIEH